MSSRDPWHKPRFALIYGGSDKLKARLLANNPTVIILDFNQAELAMQILREELHQFDEPKGLHDDTADTNE